VHAEPTDIDLDVLDFRSHGVKLAEDESASRPWGREPVEAGQSSNVTLMAHSATEAAPTTSTQAARVQHARQRPMGTGDRLRHRRLRLHRDV
jgi:hypothetical protein